jgi:hypothetical protein
MPVVEGTGKLKFAVGEYDFAVDGGAIGAITLRGGGSLGGAIPSGAVIIGGWIEIDTNFTTGTAATMALSIQTANDLQTATVVSGAPYSTTGFKVIVPVFTTPSTYIKTTAARSLTATIATGTVTAGKGRVVVAYR